MKWWLILIVTPILAFNMKLIGATNIPLCTLSNIEDEKGMLSGFVWDASSVCGNAGFIRGWEVNGHGHPSKTLTCISLKEAGQDFCCLDVSIERFTYSPRKVSRPEVVYAVAFNATTNFTCLVSCSNGAVKSSRPSAFGIPMPTEMLTIFAGANEHIRYHLAETKDFNVQNKERFGGFEDVILKRSIFLSCSGIGFLAFRCDGATIPGGNNQLCIWGFRIVEKNGVPPFVEMTGLLQANLAMYTDANINREGNVAVYCGVDGFQCKTVASLQSLVAYLKTIRAVYGQEGVKP